MPTGHPKRTRKKGAGEDKSNKEGQPASQKDEKKEDELKPKRAPRNKSATEKRLLEDKTEEESSSLRFSIIRCCLQTALKSFPRKQEFLRIFDAQARFQGAYRKVVGLLASWSVTKAISQGDEIPEINKQLFDQSWSALDSKRDPDRTSSVKGKRASRDLDEFIAATSFNIKDLPPPVRFEMRQQTTKEMETVAINHIVVNLEGRVRPYVLWKVANLPSAAYVKTKHLRRITGTMVRRLMNGQPGLANMDIEYIEPQELQDILDEVNGMIHHVLFENGRKRSDSKIRKDAHLLLPFLYHVSSEFERVGEERRILAQALDPAIPKKKRRKHLLPKWRTQGLLLPGKAFAMLPDWKIQPVFVDYKETQLTDAFGKKMGQMPIFQEKVFDLPRLRALKKPGWSMMSFRTNGVELHVMLGALKDRRPASFNTPELKKAGFQLKKPPRQVNVLQQERGVFRITQDRFDNAIVKPQSVKDVLVKVVDPGVTRVVAVREIALSDITTPTTIIDKSLTWGVTEKEYKEGIGWLDNLQFENMRRAGTRKYKENIRALRKTRKRTPDLTRFTEYAKACLDRFRMLSRELLSRCRRVMRYQRRKKIEKSMDRLADRLMRPAVDDTKKPVLFFGDGTFKPRKGHVAVPRKAIIMKCAHRGLVFVVSERGTSKYCPTPGCEGEMKDVHGCHRLRRCTNDLNGGSPCLFSRSTIDRDDSATTALAYIASAALKSRCRPAQFCC